MSSIETTIKVKRDIITRPIIINNDIFSMDIISAKISTEIFNGEMINKTIEIKVYRTDDLFNYKSRKSMKVILIAVLTITQEDIERYFNEMEIYKDVEVESSIDMYGNWKTLYKDESLDHSDYIEICYNIIMKRMKDRR